MHLVINDENVSCIHHFFGANIALFLRQLSVSGFFLWKECHSSSPPRMTKEWRSIRLYLVPSVIYLIHNNVQFATLTYVDPSTYQILGNLKIVTTGILFRCSTCLLTEVFILLCFLTHLHDRIPILFPIMLCTMPLNKFHLRTLFVLAKERL